MAMNRLQTAKVIAVVVLVLLAAVVVSQNTEAVETKILFINITMPRAALLLVNLVIGFVVGFLVAGRVRRKSA
ncbi:hypothetical protein ACFL5Q_04660 [Planctomycetota bacterium]